MIRTLVVDDDFAVAGMHRRFVEALDGFEVVGVLERGLPVAEFLAQHEVDLVLLDVHLPDRGGVQVLEDLRSAGHDVAVIMVTAASERDTVRRAVGHGVDGYLVKPFSREEFNDRLREFAAFLAAHGGPGRGAGSAPELDQSEIDRLVRGASGRARDSVDRPPAVHSSAAAPSPAVGPSGAAAPAGGTPARLPKGYSAPTLNLVGTALREAGAGVDLSAREVAAACGISRVSARRYLELLTERGLAELRPRYGSTGRPEHRYGWIG
ncbi:response regulator [Citricoccus sp. NPDC079358]|uniref:response regulator transcription factor n=1 Tax=Citricoccus sp. NPDC079358 TaxID=3154653 RepID=UPI00344B3917